MFAKPAAQAVWWPNVCPVELIDVTPEMARCWLLTDGDHSYDQHTVATYARAMTDGMWLVAASDFTPITFHNGRLIEVLTASRG
jgi:hypothetical protein